MARRKGPPIEAEIRKLFDDNPGIGMTTRFLAFMVSRDYLTVSRCLLRMKKRGQVTSAPMDGARHRHVWRLV
jgi:hypothetical protein